MKPILLFILLPLLLAASCKKDKLADELSKLPPATQTGANTFGCLVNGKAWIPDNGCTLLCPQALKFYYDNSNGGLFAITAKWKLNNREETIVIGLDSMNYKNSFHFEPNETSVRLSFNNKAGCDLSFLIDKNVETTGVVLINRFDLTNALISGTFDFTLSKLGCETIRITNGRFDAKL